jgi:CheY-like chemotaxis protein
MRRIVPERIEIKTRLSDVPALAADSTEIDQIIMNLVVNASDAISGTGLIQVATSTVDHDAAYLARHDRAQPGLHVRLSVTDDGTGMDENTKAHIFEPFFTTKPTGAGTGLGLATVFGIVRGMGGSIGVASEVGLGTTFDIDLPVNDEELESGAAGPGPLSGGSERVLLVEDEPMVLALSETILRRLGYKVTATPDPVRAAQLSASDFDLVITDVIMPAMDGPEVVRRLRLQKPDIPVLYVSGYQPQNEMSAAMDQPRTSLLPKPFTWSTLAEAVRAAIRDDGADGGDEGAAGGGEGGLEDGDGAFGARDR